MLVKDIWLNAEDKTKVLMWFGSDPAHICFRGSLKDCPKEKLYARVDKFRAVDFDIIEIVIDG